MIDLRNTKTRIFATISRPIAVMALEYSSFREVYKTSHCRRFSLGTGVFAIQSSRRLSSISFQVDLLKTLVLSYPQCSRKIGDPLAMLLPRQTPTHPPSPPGQVPNLGPTIIGVSYGICGVSTVIIALRFFARWRTGKKLWWDDWLCIPALVRVQSLLFYCMAKHADWKWNSYLSMH